MNIVARKVIKKLGECDVCGTEGVEVAVYYGGIAQCDACIGKENALLATGANRTVVQAQKIDSTVEVAQDMYNLETVACIEIQAAIQNDDTVQQKQYMAANTIKQRIELYDEAIFKKQQELSDLQTRRRASVTFIKESEFINQLRNEEREKLRLADISYIPQSPTKATIKSSASAPSSGKTAKSAAIREIAIKMGIPPEVHADFIKGVNMMMTVRKLSVDEAAKIIGAGLK